MIIDPTTIDVASRYKLMIGAIVPRPIAFASTVNASGQLNLAPFSFFAGVGSNPMTLLFCPANKADGTEKDTLRNAKPVSEGGQGEFVVNIAPAAIIRQLAACAEPLDFGQSEFDLSHLTPEPSAIVKPPRVKECPVAFECRTLQVIRTNPGQPAGGNIVLGQVVSVFADDAIINDRHHIDAAALDAVGRMGGAFYSTTRDRFEVPMGTAALAATLPPGIHPRH